MRTPWGVTLVLQPLLPEVPASESLCGKTMLNKMRTREVILQAGSVSKHVGFPLGVPSSSPTFDWNAQIVSVLLASFGI